MFRRRNACIFIGAILFFLVAIIEIKMALRGSIFRQKNPRLGTLNISFREGIKRFAPLRPKRVILSRVWPRVVLGWRPSPTPIHGIVTDYLVGTFVQNLDDRVEPGVFTAAEGGGLKPVTRKV